MNGMNLTEELPNFVELDGKRYEINTDFRIWILVDQLLFSTELSPVEKAAKMLALCYRKQLPPNAAAALRLLMQFYCADAKEKQGRRSGRSKKRIYDFEHDAGLFYAAFLEKYGIDLTVAHLHWWKFLALFHALDGGCRLCEVMHWRAVDLSKITDKGQKEFYRKMKGYYRLPDREGCQDTDLAEVLSEAVG